MSKAEPKTSDRFGVRRKPPDLVEEMCALYYTLAGLHMCMEKDPDEVEVMLQNLRPRHRRLFDFLKGEMESLLRRKNRVTSESER